jgi:tetratricopeptide (TPR) repeat protein
VACDFERLGAWATAADWLRQAPCGHAMLLYHLALCHWRLGQASEALAAAREAAQQSPLFVNPHRVEDAEALRAALQLCPDDPLAHLLLGNCLASLARWDEAAEHWTRSAQLAGSGEVAVLAWRNLALFRRHKQHNAPDALAAYAEALSALAPRPSPLAAAAWRLWLERDHVLSASGRHAERVAAFDSAPDAVRAKWQVLARWADACLRTGAPERALQLLSGCQFKPWEGEARPRVLWKEAHMALGHGAKDAGDLGKAREHFESAADYPRHLAVGKPTLTDDADALFWAGWCALQAGDKEAARRLLEAAATEEQPGEPGFRQPPGRPTASSAAADCKARAAELLRTIA